MFRRGRWVRFLVAGKRGLISLASLGQRIDLVMVTKSRFDRTSAMMPNPLMKGASHEQVRELVRHSYSKAYVASVLARL